MLEEENEIKTQHPMSPTCLRSSGAPRAMGWSFIDRQSTAKGQSSMDSRFAHIDSNPDLL